MDTRLLASLLAAGDLALDDGDGPVRDDGGVEAMPPRAFFVVGVVGPRGFDAIPALTVNRLS